MYHNTKFGNRVIFLSVGQHLRLLVLAILTTSISAASAPASTLTLSQLPAEKITFKLSQNIGDLTKGTHTEYAGAPTATLTGYQGNVPLYCVDIGHYVYVPGTYNNTSSTTNGQIISGYSGSTPTLSTVNNWQSVAYLVDTYGASAAKNADESAGLQAAIWKAIYGSSITIDGPGERSSTTSAAYSDYLEFLGDIGTLDENGNFTPNSNLDSSADFISPADQNSDTVYQGQIAPDPAPEPSAFSLFGIQMVFLTGYWRRYTSGKRASSLPA